MKRNTLFLWQTVGIGPGESPGSVGQVSAPCDVSDRGNPQHGARTEQHRHCPEEDAGQRRTRHYKEKKNVPFSVFLFFGWTHCLFGSYSYLIISLVC